MYTHATTVRFGDTDAMGHVNNAKFATYLEDARVGFFRATTAGTVSLAGLILARTEIDFVRPILFGVGPVETTVWVEHVGTKSFRLGNTMRHDGEVVGRATAVLVAYDYAAGTSRPLGDEERGLLSAHLAAAS